jgi:hypothetical protein
MMMESGFLICRYHRTSPGLANPGITMFKNPTSKFQCLKEPIVQKGPEARRLPPLASGSRPDRYRNRRISSRRGGCASEHRRPAASREPAFLDTITCFAKVSAETFVAGILRA